MWPIDIMKTLKPLAFQVSNLAVKPLAGKDIGRFRPIRAIYRYLAPHLIPEEKRLVDVNGYKMLVHMEEYKGIDGITHQELLLGIYEKYTTALFKELVGGGMNVIDIGANIGYYTLLAAKLVGDEGKVFAFEPEPQNYALLLRNIELNGYKNIIPQQKAVANTTGKVKLFLDKLEPGAHSLYKVRQSAKEAIMVGAISLDEFFAGKECPIDIIKIDVEGAEMTVLLGMTKIVKNNDNLKIFTEFWPPGLQKSGFSAQEYWHKLVENGFQYIYLINEQKQRLEPADFASVMKFCKGNLLRAVASVNLLCAKAPLEKRVIIDPA
jgi:FkbM family methyltransferase